MRCISSSEISRKGVGELVPAPLRTMVKDPTSFATRSMSAFLVTSAAMKRASPPAAWIAATRFSALAGSRPTRTTFAPARAKPSAMAPQSSPVPPVTTATSPARENCSSKKRLMRLSPPPSAANYRTPAGGSPTTRNPSSYRREGGCDDEPEPDGRNPEPATPGSGHRVPDAGFRVPGYGLRDDGDLDMPVVVVEVFVVEVFGEEDQAVALPEDHHVHVPDVPEFVVVDRAGGQLDEAVPIPPP